MYCLRPCSGSYIYKRMESDLDNRMNTLRQGSDNLLKQGKISDVYVVPLIAALGCEVVWLTIKPMRYTFLRNLDNVHSFFPLPNSLLMMRGLWICAAGSWQWPYYLTCEPLNGGTNLRYSYVGGLAVYQGADGAVLFSSQEDDYKKGNRPCFSLHLELNVVELIPSDGTCSFSKTQLYGASV